MLIEKVIDELESDGARTIFLEVRASNVEARTLYAGLAFVEVGLRHKYYRRPAEDAVVMARANPGFDDPHQ